MRRLSLSLLCLAAGAACAQTDPSVKVNGIGFLPDAHKLAVVPAGVPTSAGARFEVVEDAGGKAVLTGALAAPLHWQPSGETVRIADFSTLRKPGRYRIKAEGAPPSAPFTVGADSYCLLYTSPSPRDRQKSRMPSSA